MTESRPEILRDHAEGCFRHFVAAFIAAAPKGSKGASRAKEPLAQFCGVEVSTVTRWLYRSGVMPIGDPFLKLLCYLDALGYRVIELERMPKSHRNFAELIGFGLITSHETNHLLGYADHSKINQILMSGRPIGEDKEQRMWAVWKERREQLEARKEQVQAELPPPIAARPRPAEAVQPVAAAEETGMPKQALVSLTINGFTSWLERAKLDSLPAADLEQLRATGVANMIARLLTCLSALNAKLLIHDEDKAGG